MKSKKPRMNLSKIKQKSKPFDTKQNEPTVMIQISKNIPTCHQQPFQTILSGANVCEIKSVSFEIKGMCVLTF